jgi:type II secretory pathway pseudopilin PulG
MLLGASPSALGARRSASRAPSGFVFPLLLAGIVILGVASAGVGQMWSTQVQREKEEELLFRLKQFRTAIALYRADHNRLPKELKDLLEDRTRLQIRRYLRRIYTDPMTGKPDWQLKVMADRTGQVSGITDVNSRSEGKPLRTLPDKSGDKYSDW